MTLQEQYEKETSLKCTYSEGDYTEKYVQWLEKRLQAVKTYCWFCGTEMVWGCDFDFEDYGLDGDGIVASLSCPGCEATAEFYSKREEEEEEELE